VEEVQRALFAVPGVVSVEPVTAAADAIRDQLDEVLGVFDVIRAAVLLLTLLIAFNATAINLDERSRENATLFAFGLPVGRVLGMAVVESLLVGVAGTILGVLGGRLVLEWLTTVLLPESFPEIGVQAILSGPTIVTAVALGVVAVALAPVLTLRRLRRMDIPSTLRVVE
jgi:putative ABC transport system permease protein